MRTAICIVFLVCGLAAPAGAQQTNPLLFQSASSRPSANRWTSSLDFVGRVEAVDRVEVRARVPDTWKRSCSRKATVKEGAPLYRIEKGLFQAAVEQAEGALSEARPPRC